MSETLGKNTAASPEGDSAQDSSREVTWAKVVAAGEALERKAKAAAEQVNSDGKTLVKVNYGREATGTTTQYPAMESQKKTRDERIADGQEKVAALKNKAKEDQMQALIQHVEDTINSQIGEEIVESLDDDQLKELVQMQDNDAPAEEIDAWIRARVPEYDEIIEDNVAIVLGELANNSDAIQA